MQNIVKSNDFDLNLIVNILKSRKEHNITSRQNFRISETIWFDDIIWNFNYLNTNNRGENNYRFDFTNIPDEYVFYLKHVVLNEIKFTNNSFGSIHKMFEVLSRFFRSMYDDEKKYIIMLNKKVISQYLDKQSNTNSPSSMEKICVYLKKLFKFFKSISDYSYDDVIKYIENKNSEYATKAKLYTSKNEYIPDDFLNQTISLAIKDMNDEKLSISKRIIACLIILIAETGMRIEEASLLESNMLDTIYIDSIGKEVNYLNFKTFKTKDNIGEYKETFCYLSDIASNAYRTCEQLMSNAIDNLNEIPNLRRLIILNGMESKLPKPSRVSALRKIVNNIPIDELEKIKKIEKKYLFIDGRTGLQKKGADVLRENLVSFYIRHSDDINLDNLSSSEIESLNILNISSKSKFEKEFTKEQRHHLSYDNIKEKNFYYVNPHRFRVTVCTKLFVQDVHLDFIVTHMNHISEDMTNYYNKSYTLKNDLKEALNILSLMSPNSGGLIESDSSNVESDTYKLLLSDDLLKESISKMNSFLKKNKLNILTDINVILKKLEKLSAPVATNDFGICINIITQKICENRESFSKEIGSYFLNITLPTYKDIHYTYELFEERVKVVNHNKKILEKNNLFLNEYERELNILKHLVENKLNKEVQLLNNDLNTHGYNYVVEKYPNAEYIAKNINKIQKEINKWI